MFDAKSLFDMMVKGAGQSAQGGGQSGGGGLADILGQLAGQGSRQGGGAQQGGGQQGGGGLEDLLRQLTQGQGGGQPGASAQAPQAAPSQGGGLGDLMRNMFPGGGGQQSAPQSQAPQGGGGLADILGELQRRAGGGGTQPNAAPSQGGDGGLLDQLGKILGQATQGAREGAGRLGEATGANDALGRVTGGRSADDILAQLKDLVGNNQLGAGAALGGLGALVLGTQTGRSVAAQAARLGALALVGGLAYKAFQNYQAGRPLITGATDGPLQPAPNGTGFEEAAVTNDVAVAYIQAMIAAAAADGRIDEEEQARIIGSLKQAGVDAEAEEFLAEEFNNPATPEALAESVETQEQAVQLYTAARIAIEPDTAAEQTFLQALATELGIEPALAQHIDAQARQMAAA